MSKNGNVLIKVKEENEKMKICPKCELNWIEDNDEYCPMCCVHKKIERPVREYIRTGGEIGSKFYNFLVNCGYKEFTNNGQPSTVHSYMTAIEKVCLWENCTWLTLAQEINTIAREYDFGGSRETFGNQSHRTVYNALVAYSWFVKKYRIA